LKKIKRFEWDAGNISHIARHNVRPGEVEEVFWDKILPITKPGRV